MKRPKYAPAGGARVGTPAQKRTRQQHDPFGAGDPPQHPVPPAFRPPAPRKRKK